jgi:glutamyl-Q tRNA(Asp) synthetase
VWGVARLAGATVVLRIEDHDRGRSRPEFDLAIAEDLAWLGFAADDGPVRQSDADAVRAYEAALDALTSAGRTYRCACSRATFAAWARDHGGTWTGRGCPSACRSRPIPADGAIAIRVDVGDGEERFDDILLGQRSGTVAPTGDLVARDRDGNWTYSFAVVVDDLRTGVDLVIRGDDLVDETPRQIRLGTLLGRAAPPRFLHHPLVRTAAGRKLSKSAGDVAVAELRAAGASASDVRAAAARAGKVPLEVVTAAAGARRE